MSDLASLGGKERPPTIAELISTRCRELGLSQLKRVRRLRNRNVPGKLRRLEVLLAGKIINKRKLAGSGSEPDHAVQKTRQPFDEKTPQKKEAEIAAWRTSFKPHAVILTERTAPSPRFVAAAIGVEQILRIDFDVSGNPATFLGLALDGIKRKLARWKSNKLPAFGRPTGIVLNYLPDFAVRFDLDGTAQEIFREAYRIGQAHLLAHGRPVPSAA